MRCADDGQLRLLVDQPAHELDERGVVVGKQDTDRRRGPLHGLTLALRR